MRRRIWSGICKCFRPAWLVAVEADMEARILGLQLQLEIQQVEIDYLKGLVEMAEIDSRLDEVWAE